MSHAATSIHEFAHRAINWSIVLSILLIVAGFFTLLIPFLGGIGVTLFVGWALMISGVTHLVLAWKGHNTGARLWELLVGLAYLFAGVYLILHPVAGLASLTLLLAFYLFFEGIFEVLAFFQMRSRPGAGWLLFDGAITLLLAFMIWRHWPFSSVWAVGTLVGVSMLFSGFSRLMLSMGARQVLKAA
ncbi:HdeD family acid-resistance protein [Edaphobacter sp. 12200R-103]|jgi:uncharacterized membrane protein HdeD (DUF308 family)|uniref:HdeD family acid-resistance protein n=1 Tax=Edaphobacter sp. 12200R-103 TaxID=2703788 RepID=UPI00138CC072|nr:DUF308 domain-containing protein [Edaphobacter sp. 12200R-103]QHS53532.1 hypothetical protein GWR55_18800 [Edaphobacter sp. 12200R-103]